LSAPNNITDLYGPTIRTFRVTAKDAGLPVYPAEAIRGGDATYNAAALRALLTGTTGAYRDAVLLNASGALIVAGVAADWKEGVVQAANIIDSGQANTLLNRWIKHL
jgi:anthranilate phosphoribosyltransferase